MNNIPNFIPHESAQMTAGAGLDEPEEGDLAEINGEAYEYLGIAEERDGELVEVFGWWRRSGMYAHPPVMLTF